MKQTLNKLKVRNDFLNNIVSELVKQRQKLELTQEELNAILGITDRLLGKWEVGIRTPTCFHLYCWAEALNMQLAVIANDNTPPEPVCQLSSLAVNDNHFGIVK